MPTLATIKSFINKAKQQEKQLYIKNLTDFDGMVDCVTSCDNQEFRKVEFIDKDLSQEHTLGIRGAWFVLMSRDHFEEWSNGQFTGYKIYNSCGSFILAIKQ